jgi:hypothetical protein
MWNLPELPSRSHDIFLAQPEELQRNSEAGHVISECLESRAPNMRIGQATTIRRESDRVGKSRD